jgi:hypothetical protein
MCIAVVQPFSFSYSRALLSEKQTNDQTCIQILPGHATIGNGSNTVGGAKVRLQNFQ